MIVGRKEISRGYNMAVNLNEDAEKPSFLETNTAYWGRHNPLPAVYRMGQRFGYEAFSPNGLFQRFFSSQSNQYAPIAEQQNSLFESVKESLTIPKSTKSAFFNALTTESTQDIPKEYWPYLDEAQDDDDLRTRKNIVSRKLKDEDVLRRSGKLATLTAGFLEMWFDPTTYIPMAKIRKYASYGESFMKNALAAMPSTFGSVGLSNAVVDLSLPHVTAKDWAFETAVQGMIGSAINGIVGAWNIREVFLASAGTQAAYHDTKIYPIIAEKTSGKYKKGEVVGYQALKDKDIEQLVTASNVVDKENAVITANLEKGKLTRSQAKRLQKAVEEAELKQSSTVSEIVSDETRRVQSMLDHGIALIGENKLFKLLYKPIPLIRGLTSAYDVVRELTNHMFSHHLVLGKMEHPKLRELNSKMFAAKKLLKEAKAKHGLVIDSGEIAKIEQEIQKIKLEKKSLASEEFKAIFNGKPQQDLETAQAVSMLYLGKMNNSLVAAREIWKEGVGFGGAVSSRTPMLDTAYDAIKKLSSETRPPTFRQCMEDAALALRCGQKSDNPIAQEIAELFRKEVYDPLLKELKELQLLPENMDTATAMSYLNRMYDKKFIKHNEDEFVAHLEKFFETRDKKILEITAPIKKVKDEVEKAKLLYDDNIKVKEEFKAAKQDVTAIDAIIKQSEKKLEVKTKELGVLEDELQYKIDTGTFDLTEEELANGLTQASLVDGKPTFTKALKDEHEALSKPLIEAKEKLENIKKTTPEDLKSIKEQKKLIKQLNEDLNQKIERGEVSEELYFKTKKGKNKLISIKKKTLAMLVKTAKDADSRLFKVKAIVDTILQENDQQMASRLFSGISGRKGTPSALKRRKLLCSDYYIEKYLVNDLESLASAHVGNLSNLVALEKMFRKFKDPKTGKAITESTAEDYLISRLKEQYEDKKKIIHNSPSSPERNKQIDVLEKEYKQAQNQIKDSLQIFRGDYGRPTNAAYETMQDVIDNSKRYAFSTMMGGVGLMFQMEIIMPVVKHGFYHFRKGVLSTIGQFFDAKLPRHMWGDAGVGLNTALASIRKKIWGEDRATTKFFNNLTKFSGNFFTINQFSDIAENMAASTAASALIRDLKRWKEGHLFTKKELEGLELGRFDMQKHGDAILKMIDTHGKEAYGGFIPNTSKWENLEAANHFNMYIKTEVNHLVNRPWKADSPFCARHPTFSLMTQFMSYGFGLTNNVTIPMLQRMDVEKLTYATLGVLLGSLTAPMRQLASGDEVDMNWRTLLNEGIFQSGIIGFHWGEMIKLNSVLDIPAFRPFQSDRFKRKSLADLYLGPVGSMLNTAGKAASMFVNRELNQQDLTRCVHAIPLLRAYYLRKPLHDWFESLDIPKKASKKYYGEDAETVW